MTKHEFASPEWFDGFDVLFGLLRERHAAIDLNGVHGSQSEEYVEPPLSISPAGTSIG